MDKKQQCIACGIITGEREMKKRAIKVVNYFECKDREACVKRVKKLCLK